MSAEARRLLLFGDPRGLPQLLAALPRDRVVGLVGAAIRPQQHRALQAIARQAGLPLLIQPPAASEAGEAFAAAVRALAPDMLLVNSYAQRLPAALLALAPLGGFNLHGALLPRYRGASPLQHALLNMEQESGVTLHVMTADFDEGPVIAERRVPIRFDDTWAMVHARIIRATEALLASELPRLIAGTWAATPQDPQAARYYRRRYPQDGLLDWRRDALSLYNMVRGLVSPHPGAFYEAGGRRIVLDRYVSLPRVAALKYAPEAGRQRRMGPTLQAAPLTEAEAPAATLDRNDQLWVRLRTHAGSRVGLVRLSRLDFHSRTAELTGKWGPSATCPRREGLALALAVAFLDLNLQQVVVAESGVISRSAFLRDARDLNLITPL